MTTAAPVWNRVARHWLDACDDDDSRDLDAALSALELEEVPVQELIEDFQTRDLLDWERLSLRCGAHTGLMWHVAHRFASRLVSQIEVIQDLALAENSPELAAHAMRLCTDATSVAADSIAATARRIALAASASNYARMNPLVRHLRELSRDFNLLGASVH